MATIIPPAATLSVTGKRAAMPDATVSLLNKEFPRFPCSAAFSQIQYWAKKPSFRWSCAGDLGDLRRGGLGASGEGDGRVARDDQDEREDAERDEEQQQNGDEQPTGNERQEGATARRHRRLAHAIRTAVHRPAPVQSSCGPRPAATS